MRTLILLLSLLICIGCKSNRLMPSKGCKKVEDILKKFANKLHPMNDRCYTFDFEKDSLKYIDYAYIDGEKHFMDFRINEIFYYQHFLTNEYLDLDSNITKCLQQLNKSDFIKLFGKPSGINEFYNQFSYDICFKEDYTQKNTNYILLKFNSDGYLDQLLINIYGL